MKNQLFVGNLSFNANEEDVKEFFSEHGNLEAVEVRLPTDKVTGRMRGFGFVTFKTEEEAERGLLLNNKILKGRELRINLAEERQDRGGERRSSNPRSNDRDSFNSFEKDSFFDTARGG